METSMINWLAVGVAAVGSFLVGGLWYGPLFGRTWMRAAEMTEEEIRSGNSGVIFGVSLLLQVIAAAVLALFIGPDAGLVFGLLAGGSVGLAWVAGAFGVVYLFERRPLSHWAVNAGYQVLAYLLMGAILAAWS